MGKILTLSLDPSFRLEIDTPYILPHPLLGPVDEIWAAEKRKRGNGLVNGTLYSLTLHTPAHLKLQPIEYRHVLARRRAPELAQSGLTIRPVAVTGLLFCAEGLVLGRRNASVTSDNGLWEPVPSGGLTRDDPKAQIYEELAEEVGLNEADLAAEPRALGLIEDTASAVIDIVFQLQTALSAEAVLSAHAGCGSPEHDTLQIIPSTNVPAFLDENDDELLPALRSMLALARLGDH